MSIISSLFIFSLCLSMHSRNARRFGVVDLDSSRQLHFPSKVEEKVEIKMDSIQRETYGDSLTRKSHGGAVTQKPNGSMALLQNMKFNKGIEIVESSFHAVLPNATKIEESRRRSRAVVEIGNHVKGEEIESSDNGVREDLVEADYDPPHRNPPSHNK